MRIAILGNSGSGKSTAARWLAEHYAAPVLDLDTIAWAPGDDIVRSAAHESKKALDQFCAQPSWIIEGCYEDLIQHCLDWKPHLLFLNPGTEQAVENCLSRPWEPHKYASKDEQDLRLSPLLAWVREYESRDGPMSCQAHRSCFAAYDGPKTELLKQPEADELVLIVEP